MKSTLAMALAAALLLSISSVSQDTQVFAQDKPEEKPAEEKPEAKTEEKPVDYKLLWTVDEIRAAWGKGVSYSYDMKFENDGVGKAQVDIWNTTDKGFTGRRSITEKGKFLEQGDADERTWDRHMSELAKMIKDATTKQEKVETAVQEFDCTCYTMVKETEGSKWTTHMWLSKDLPGMWVKISRVGELKNKTDIEEWQLSDIGMPAAKRPWSNESVAGAWSEGATMVFSAKQGETSAKITLNVLKADSEGVKYNSTELVDGNENPPSEETDTWDEFFRSVFPPVFDTTITEEKLKTAAGEFDCVKYTHVSKSEGGSSSITTWAAKDKPGLLVKIVQAFTFGEESMEMVLELTEYKYGK